MARSRAIAALAVALGIGGLGCHRGVASRDESDAALRARIEAVGAEVQGAFARVLATAGQTYRPATIRIVVGDVVTPCGQTEALIGFYCAQDQTAYVELGYFREVRRRHGGLGDRAHAYVVAHELGHHVQAVLGLAGSDEAAATDPAVAVEASRRIELQADCYAGVWAHETRHRGLATRAQVERAMAVLAGPSAAPDVPAAPPDPPAAAPTLPGAVGEGRHGTAGDRLSAFLRGRELGTLAACDAADR